MQVSNKTGLVLKISVVLFVLLATVVYKLNGYFKTERTQLAQERLRSDVVATKTAVANQLTQLRNTLSSYESSLVEADINWVQLDPFFAVARLQRGGSVPQVLQIVGRSNTPAERWNAAYFEKALAVNRPQAEKPILVQLFQDRAGAKFVILRFQTADSQEVAVAGEAGYFQKFFDIDRGGLTTSLMATGEGLLAAHSVADYVATPTQETKLSAAKYLFEKEEIGGTNLVAVNYVLKSKISGAVAVPWSIIGVVAGFGCILMAVLFYSLDPIERRIERYKKQEREHIYKETLGQMAGHVSRINLANPLDAVAAPAPATPSAAPITAEASQLPSAEPVNEAGEARPAKAKVPAGFYSIENTASGVRAAMPEAEGTAVRESVEPEVDEVTVKTDAHADRFLEIENDKIDLSDIEKALALDDFDSEDAAEVPTPQLPDIIEQSLTPQKISLSSAGAPVEKPQFAMERKKFLVDEFQVKIRRPEKL